MRSGSNRLLLILILIVTCLVLTKLSPSTAFDNGSSLMVKSGIDRVSDVDRGERQVVEPLTPLLFFPLILLDNYDGKLVLELSQFAAGLVEPVGIVNAGDDRLFVIERGGRVRIIGPDGTVVPTPFLDITGRVDSSSSEQGLLGIAFHPDYSDNGVFYLNYTNTNTTDSIRRTRISRFSVTADSDIANPGSEEILVTVTQPAHNHNAGHIMFGPDGYLYLPLGDGGGGGDTQNNAQNPGLLLGKVSRIDVDSGPGAAPDCVGLGTGNYTVPSGNPFVDGPGKTCDEIWLSGLRNPWQSSFDSLTGDLYIGDVGQGLWEEVNIEPAGSAGGTNFGWRCYEGNHPYNTAGCGPMGQYVFPIFEYGHTGGNCSVIGGFVYRGKANPDMAGHYFLTDYCTGIYWDLYQDDSGVWMATEHNNLQTFGFSAFGEAVNGELYVANKSSGIIYHLEDKAPVPIIKAQTP